MRSAVDGEQGGVLSGAFFSYGFRPFFLSAGCYAPIAIAYWLGSLMGWWPAPAQTAPAWWHGHEMVFGWAIAAVCGFLLTAVPNWTSTPPVTGFALASLWGLWLLGRFGIVFSASLPEGIGALLDLLLIPGLLFFVLPPIYRSRRARYYVFPVFLVVLWVANLLSLMPFTPHWPGRATDGLYLGTYAMIAMLTIIGGRVVPNFTRGALLAEGKEPSVRMSEPLAKAAVIGVVVALAIDLVARIRPSTEILVAINGWGSLLVAVLLVLRAKDWRFGAVLSNPLIWILHVGQGWLIVAFAARAMACLLGWIPATAAFHAMGAGAMAAMILGFLTRAPLGHTGRPLRASKVTAFAYLLVIAAGTARVISPLLPVQLQLSGLIVAGSFFALAFAIYGFEYFPILTRATVR